MPTTAFRPRYSMTSARSNRPERIREARLRCQSVVSVIWVVIVGLLPPDSSGDQTAVRRRLDFPQESYDQSPPIVPRTRARWPEFSPCTMRSGHLVPE